MKRILIFGNSGSGKSTLAKVLVEREQSAHLDLDTLAWQPTTTPLRTSLDEAGSKIHDFMSVNKSWIIEGCYSDLLELASPAANEIIFMDLSVTQCIENAKKRPWEPHKYKSKEAQDAKLEMLMQWIEAYENRNDVFSYAAHLKLYEDFSGIKNRYTRNTQAL